MPGFFSTTEVRPANTSGSGSARRPGLGGVGAAVEAGPTRTALEKNHSDTTVIFADNLLAITSAADSPRGVALLQCVGSGGTMYNVKPRMCLLGQPTRAKVFVATENEDWVFGLDRAEAIRNITSRLGLHDAVAEDLYEKREFDQSYESHDAAWKAINGSRGATTIVLRNALLSRRQGTVVSYNRNASNSSSWTIHLVAAHGIDADRRLARPGLLGLLTVGAVLSLHINSELGNLLWCIAFSGAASAGIAGYASPTIIPSSKSPEERAKFIRIARMLPDADWDAVHTAVAEIGSSILDKRPLPGFVTNSAELKSAVDNSTARQAPLTAELHALFADQRWQLLNRLVNAEQSRALAKELEAIALPADDHHEHRSTTGRVETLFLATKTTAVFAPVSSPDLIGLLLNEDLAGGDAKKDESALSMVEWIEKVISLPLTHHGLIQWILGVAAGGGRRDMEAFEAMDELTGVEKIATFCLAQQCPNAMTADVLRGTFKLPPQIEAFAFRVNGQYGIHVISSLKHSTMRELGFPMVEVDVSWLVASSFQDQELYSEIVRHFSPETLFVYVRGLESIPDRTVKWLAEYTRRAIFHYVMLEDTVTVFNHCEDRDRMCTRHAIPRSLAEERLVPTSTAAKRVLALVPYTPIDSAAAGISHIRGAEMSFNSALNATWEGELAKMLQPNSGVNVAVVISSPGAGKTYTVTVMRKKRGAAVVPIIDASSPDLVRVSLKSWLDNHLGDTAEILIVDEYHRLDEYQKASLFDWIHLTLLAQPHLKVVMIGNRHSAYDDRLIEDFSAASKMTTELLWCRLSIAKAVTGITPAINSHKQGIFLTIYFTAARNLFGDEAISLRNRSDLLAMAAQPTISVSNLAALVLDKMPTSQRDQAAAQAALNASS